MECAWCREPLTDMEGHPVCLVCTGRSPAPWTATPDSDDYYTRLMQETPFIEWDYEDEEQPVDKGEGVELEDLVDREFEENDE